MIYKTIKRIFDFVCALLGIVGTSPIWILSIILTELSDPGPLFYFANRVGKDNKKFKMWKFRSMRVARGANEASLRPDQDRIFWWGKIMRRLKIDELPQLMNILVTYEKSNPNSKARVLIPDACEAVGANYCDLNAVLRGMGVVI